MNEPLASATIWNELRRTLSVGDKFETWSTTGRARAIPFVIDRIDNSELVIRRNNDGETYKVFRQSIEKMADVWGALFGGQYARADMGKFTFASSYILGIFAQLTGRK